MTRSYLVRPLSVLPRLLVASAFGAFVSACAGDGSQSSTERASDGPSSRGQQLPEGWKIGDPWEGVDRSLLREANADEPCIEDPLEDSWIGQRISDDARLDYAFAGGRAFFLDSMGGASYGYHVYDQVLVLEEQPRWVFTKDLGTSGGARMYFALDGSLAFRNSAEEEILDPWSSRPTWTLAPEPDMGFRGLALLGEKQALLTRDGVIWEYTFGGDIGMETMTDYQRLTIHPVDLDLAVVFAQGDGAEFRALYTWGVGLSPWVRLPDDLDGDPQRSSQSDNGWGGQTLFFSTVTGRFSPDGVEAGIYVQDWTGEGWQSPVRLGEVFGERLGAYTSHVAFTRDEALIAGEREESIQVRTRRDGEWSDWLELPRSRGAQFFDIKGDARGNVVVIGLHEDASSGISVRKVFRRGVEGTWYCPLLLSARGNLDFALGDAAAFLGIGGIDLPLDVWTLVIE